MPSTPLSYRHAQAIGLVERVPLFRHLPSRRHGSLRHFIGVMVELGGAPPHKSLMPCRLILSQKCVANFGIVIALDDARSAILYCEEEAS
jgi:hypothetical protein